MTVSNQTPYNTYTGNGVTTVFPFDFKLLAEGDLVVTVDDSVVSSSAYVITGIGVAAGGDVTFTTAPASGAEIIIEREIDLERLVDYQYVGDLRSEVLNPDFDRLWMAHQQVQAQLDRMPLLPIISDLRNLEFPAPGAGNYIRWNLAGTGLEAVEDTADAGTFLQSGAGAVLRSAQSKMGERISVLDFGADNTGVADSWMQITACAIVCRLARAAMWVPRGTYLLTYPVEIDDGVQVEAESRESTAFHKTTNNLPLVPIGSATVTRSGTDYVYDYDVDAIVIIRKPSGRTYPNGIALRNISLKGVGVTVEHGVYAPRLARSHLQNVFVQNVVNGYFTYDTFTTVFDRVDLWNVSYGFRFENDGSGLGTGTSCTFNGCGVNFATVYGWYLYGLSYWVINGSFAESIIGATAGSRPVAWFFNLCKGGVVNGCGSEVVKGFMFRVNGGSVTVNGGIYGPTQGDTFGADTAVVQVSGGGSLGFEGTIILPTTSPGNIYNEIVVDANSKLTYHNCTRPSGGNTNPLFTGGGEIHERGKYGGKDTRQNSTGTFTAQEYYQHQLTFYDPANIADGDYIDVTVIGSGSRAELGDIVVCSFSLDLPGLFLVGRVSSAGAIKVQIRNESGGAVDLAGGTLLARVFPK